MLSTISSQHKSLDSPSYAYQSQNISTDSVTCLPVESLDFVDNPIRRDILQPDRSEEKIFQHMKSECNRLYSYQNKWPLHIPPESLAAAGLFYLQQEDRVQCPFCYIIIFNWTQGDKPLREHMKRSPKCPFLMGKEVGNIPLSSTKHQPNSASSVSERGHSSHSVSVSYKPRHPKMADVKRRILTYSGWPLNEPTPQQLAECGLFYSGIADVVTCFFCGGTLGNWELDDNPWNEHFKFFPECTFLAMTKNKKISSNIVNLNTKAVNSQHNLVSVKTDLKHSSTRDEILKQALDIFPKDLVHEAVKRKNGSIFSLQELCDTVLELKKKPLQQNVATIPKETVFYPQSSVTPLVWLDSKAQLECLTLLKSFVLAENAIEDDEKTSNPVMSELISEVIPTALGAAVSTDLLLCKVCMDRERGVVFQPCGHFVSCWNCANLIADCPVCRSPIVHKIRTYIS